MRYPLPKDTADVLALPASRSGNRNLGLALDRYLEIGDDWRITEDAKRRKHNLNMTHPLVQGLFKNVKARRLAMLADWRNRAYTVPDFAMTVDYRLVVGFGAEHVLETSICLHRIYGFPMIPGSAVKGVARAAAFWELAEKLNLEAVTPEEAARRAALRPPQKTPLQQLDELLSEGDGKKQKKLLAKLQQDALCSTTAQALAIDQWQAMARDFYSIFGTTEQRGAVIFFDAYPQQMPRLEPDVLNPHAGPYYSDKQRRTPPADYHSPVPTFFLTVAAGTQFQFAIASTDSSLATQAEMWLREGLTELGIGGKTSAGYGFMR